MGERAWAVAVVQTLSELFPAAGDADRAEGQSAYMRHQFPFFGIAAPDQKRLLREAMASAGTSPDEADLDAFARDCYGRAEREWHYAAVGALRTYSRVLTPTSIPLVRHLVVTHSWWDTVDAIASHVAGAIVEHHPETVSVMDEWARSDNMWLARTAILHQLRFKESTDVERLFRYCLARADEPDFFYRKAIGWALRQYARTDPDAVRAFCARHEHELAPLSLREARKHLSP